MSTDHIVALLIAERERLNDAIAALKGNVKPSSMDAPPLVSEPKKKRFVSAASRRKMAVAQKKRYAALKAAKG
jgi:hypothetical protein